MIGTFVGSYRLTKLLGEGGMGAVYEAVNDAMERRVAVKVLHPDFARQPDVVNRFFNEARAVNRIAHPSLVQIHEFGHLPNGTAFIIMEYLSGETVAQRLVRMGGRMPSKVALQIAWQVAAALTAAHEKDIVHRDLKPANLMLVPDPLGPGGERVKALDFGIAKLVADTRQGQTSTKMILGTPAYMSPEQCRSAGSVDDKTDVYALGCILYELLTGRPPFVAEGAGELMAMHIFENITPIRISTPDVPPDVAAYTERLLAKDRTQRPSMREVAQTLAQLLTGIRGRTASSDSLTVAVVNPGLAPLPHQPRTTGHSHGQRIVAPPQRNRMMAILTSVGICAVAGSLAWWLTQRPAAPTSSAARSIGTPVDSAGGGNKTVSSSSVPSMPASQPVGSGVKDEGRHAAAAQPVRQGMKQPSVRKAGNATPSPAASSRDDDDDFDSEPSRPTSPPPASGPDSAEALEKAQFERILQQAQNDFVKENYDAVIEEARAATKYKPSLAWLLIAASACKSKKLRAADEAYAHLDAKGQAHIEQECLKKGIEHTAEGFQKIGY